MPALSQSQIDSLVAKLQFYKYQVSFGESILGPLNSPPKVEPDIETKDTVLYETGVEAVASILSKNNAKITLEVNDVDTAMGLLEEFRKGDNMLDSSKGKPLVLVPITDDADASTITFSNCYLQPGVSASFASGDDPNFVTMNFIAKPVAETGVLFTAS